MFLPNSLPPLLNFTLRLIVRYFSLDTHTRYTYSVGTLFSPSANFASVILRTLSRPAYFHRFIPSFASSSLDRSATVLIIRVCSPTTLTHTHTTHRVEKKSDHQRSRESLRFGLVHSQRRSSFPCLLTCLTSAPRLGPFHILRLVQTHEPLDFFPLLLPRWCSLVTWCCLSAASPPLPFPSHSSNQNYSLLVPSFLPFPCQTRQDRNEQTESGQVPSFPLPRPFLDGSKGPLNSTSRKERVPYLGIPLSTFSSKVSISLAVRSKKTPNTKTQDKRNLPLRATGNKRLNKNRDNTRL